MLAEAVLTSTHNQCFEQKYEKYQNFYLKIFIFLVVKFSIHLNRRVFVMSILYNSKFTLHVMATSLGTNAVIFTRVDDRAIQ